MLRPFWCQKKFLPSSLVRFGKSQIGHTPNFQVFVGKKPRILKGIIGLSNTSVGFVVVQNQLELTKCREYTKLNRKFVKNDTKTGKFATTLHVLAFFIKKCTSKFKFFKLTLIHSSKQGHRVRIRRFSLTSKERSKLNTLTL